MSTNNNNIKLSGNIINLSNKHQHQSQIHQQSNLVIGQQQQTQLQHAVPPRYQPPPQPPGGILKNIPSSKTVSTLHPSDTTTHHLNIKYPPEVPKLAAVYIPESSRGPAIISTKSAPSRPLLSHRHSTGQPLVQQTNQNQHNRLSTEEEHLVRLQSNTQQIPQQEMLKFVRKSDSDNAPSANAGRIASDQNRHLQSLLSELRTLKEANQLLSEDNQELRDLCCFLDDDRQKGRKLAREWQRFGRYTASVMRQEVSAYQNKLRQLDDKQQELIRDNLELKELCLYLDEERANVAANVSVCTHCGAAVRPALRDDGDGSSSSTNADEPMPSVRQFERQIPELNIRPSLSDQTLQYVRSLERKIRQLEKESITANPSHISTDTDPVSGRPEAVVRALQILEVREQLERDRADDVPSASPEHMDDGEKALVREMCNVVWRKLEDGPNCPGMQI